MNNTAIIATEFRQMALELHSAHSGRSILEDNIDVVRDCSFTFCRDRYRLLQHLLIPAENLPPGEVHCSRCGLRSAHAKKEPSGLCLSCLIQTNTPGLAGFKYDDNSAPSFGDDSDK